MKEISSGRLTHVSEQFKFATEEQLLATEKLKQASNALVERLSAGGFSSSKELQAFLDGELIGLLGSVSAFMEKTNALRSACEDALVLFTDALDSREKTNQKLQKEIDRLRIQVSLGSIERH